MRTVWEAGHCAGRGAICFTVSVVGGAGFVVHEDEPEGVEVVVVKVFDTAEIASGDGEATGRGAR